MANTVSRTLSDDTLNRIIQIESAGNPSAKAPTSSAAGLGQFIKATWLNTVSKHRPDLMRGKTPEQVAALRVGPDNAALQLEMLARFTEDNARELGPGLTDGDLYLAHFLGIGDARRLFRAPPGDLASHHVTAAAVAANKSILQDKTCGQVRAWAQASMETRWVKAGKPNWVARYAGAPAIIPPPPDVPKIEPKPPVGAKKQTGIVAAILAVLSIILAFVQAHPMIIGGAGLAIIGGVAFWLWRRSRRDEYPID